jgi:hypothetical protein
MRESLNSRVFTRHLLQSLVSENVKIKLYKIYNFTHCFAWCEPSDELAGTADE